MEANGAFQNEGGLCTLNVHAADGTSWRTAHVCSRPACCHAASAVTLPILSLCACC